MTVKIQALIAALILAAGPLYAQQPAAPKEADAAKQESTTETKEQPARQRGEPYRFQYTFAELNGKEKINSRTFEIFTSNRGEMHTNSHIPVRVGNLQFQYMDVGLDLNMNWGFNVNPDEIFLKVEADMTSIVKSDAAAADTEKSAVPNMITRRTTIKADTVVKPGTPTVIGRVEDVASSHSYELSVIVTRR